MDTLVSKAAEFVKGHKLTSWGQRENGLFFLSMIEGLIEAKAKPEVKQALMKTASNASAFRQRLESAEVLPKSEGRKTGKDIFAEYSEDL